jgi:NADPH:quinone reductase-like Zn-dependent oxidoreductase
MPEPKEGEVLVKINAVSLNYRDTEVVMDTYGHHASLTGKEKLVPCSDICGTVVSSNGTDLAEGTRVMGIFNQTHLKGQCLEKDLASGLGLPLQGCLTQYRCFPASGLVKVPDYLSDEEASCLPIASVTAWMAINSFRPMGDPFQKQDGKTTVLIQGTGGVAIAGLQIAHAAGCKTVITSSSDAKLERAKKMGADVGINYRTNTNWQDAVNEATDGKGADIIFENGGAQTLRQSFDCISFGGLISLIGYLTGKEMSKNDYHTNVLALRRNVTLKGILNGPKDRFEEMNGFYEKWQIKPVVDKVFAFEEAKEGLKYLFAGGHFGKVVVKVQ